MRGPKRLLLSSRLLDATSLSEGGFGKEENFAVPPKGALFEGAGERSEAEGVPLPQNLNNATMRCHRRVKKLPSLTVSTSAAVVSAAGTVSPVL